MKLIKHLRGTSALCQDQRGNVASIFALSLLPIIGIMGLAVDMSLASNARNHAQQAIDNAVLAAARERVGRASESEIQAAFENFFEAHLDSAPGNMTCTTPTLRNIGTTMTGSANCSNETLISGILNADKMSYGVESSVAFGIGKLDIAMVFDVSGSMSWDSGDTQFDSRLDALKAAAKKGVDDLLTYNTDDRDDIRIAMASYSNSVNAGAFFEYATGKPATRTYTHGSGGSGVEVSQGGPNGIVELGLYDTDTNQRLTTIENGGVIKIPNLSGRNLALGVTVPSDSYVHDWIESMRLTLNNGEHSQLENVEPYALFGDNNGAFNPGLNLSEGQHNFRLDAYQRDNARGYLGYMSFNFRVENSVQEHEVTNTCTYERNSSEWDQATEPRDGHYISASDAWYNESAEQWVDPSSCNEATPVALTTDKDTLEDYIDSLNAGGGTAGHMGLAWGRYMLSPDWSDAFDTDSKPLAWNKPDTQKILIMMTDGAFNSTYHGNLGNSFNQAKAQCDDARHNDNVLIYTIAFNAPSEGEQILDYCASGPEFVFNANNGQDLLDAYTAIAASISDLRLAKTPERPSGGGVVQDKS
jgi:Flp pilus assembly protein TadG